MNTKSIFQMILGSLLVILRIEVVEAQQNKTTELPTELQQVLNEYEKYWRASDAKSLASLFTEDGFILRPGYEIVQGRAKIAQAYANAGGPLVLKAYDYQIADELAYIIGGYAGEISQPAVGKFTLILKKVDKAWLIHSDMDNANHKDR